MADTASLSDALAAQQLVSTLLSKKLLAERKRARLLEIKLVPFSRVSYVPTQTRLLTHAQERAERKSPRSAENRSFQLEDVDDLDEKDSLILEQDEIIEEERAKRALLEKQVVRRSTLSSTSFLSFSAFAQPQVHVEQVSGGEKPPIYTRNDQEKAILGCVSEIEKRV